MRMISSIALLVAFMTMPVAASLAGEWLDTGSKGDWSGNDYACSAGSTPVAAYCDAAHEQNIAVCWTPDDRQTGFPDGVPGDCRGASAWCTYKTNRVLDPQTGAKPGRVYVCQE